MSGPYSDEILLRNHQVIVNISSAGLLDSIMIESMMTFLSHPDWVYIFFLKSRRKSIFIVTYSVIQRTCKS